MGEHRSCSVTGRQLRGINRAGAEYGSTWEGWDNNPYFEWPSAAIRMNELDHFASKGMNVVRLPISWERLQHTLNGSLDPEYRCNLEKYVAAATAAGFSVVIDLHNYGRYATGTHDADGKQVGSYTQRVLGDGVLTFAHVADVWTKIAGLFVDNPRVIFGLMNEQHGADPTLDSTAVFTGYQTVLDAVRATGAKQLVLFPNTWGSDTRHWEVWVPQGSGPLDAIAALNVKDSAGNLAFDMHSYMDTRQEDQETWLRDIEVVTKWAREERLPGERKCLFLSELGSKLGAADVSTLLTYINANPDVWVGWAVWNLEPYSITSTDKETGAVTDTPRMPWYAPFF
jgi:endoglucanase